MRKFFYYWQDKLYAAIIENWMVHKTRGMSKADFAGYVMEVLAEALEDLK